MLFDCNAMTCPSWNLITARASLPTVTVWPPSTGSPLPTDLGADCGEDTATSPDDWVICPAGAANTELIGSNARVIQENMRRVFGFMGTLHRNMKKPACPPRGEPGPENQKARHVAWPRHQCGVGSRSMRGCRLLPLTAGGTPSRRTSLTCMASPSSASTFPTRKTL